MANYRHYGPGTPRLEGPTPEDYQEGEMNHSGVDMLLQEKGDRIAALTAEIAELRAERERVMALAERWKLRSDNVHSRLAEELLAAMNPEGRQP